MYTPPKILLWLLNRFCPPSRQDLKGDFLELYENRAGELGRSKANWQLFLDACTVWNFRFFMQSQLPDNKLNRMSMLYHYVKMAWRVLLRNPATSLISIVGFAVAVACALTGFLYADFLSDLDSFHSKRGDIYQVISRMDQEGEERLYGPSPVLLGQHLGADHPEVQQVVRLQYSEGNVRLGTSVFRERLMFADPAFLQVFDFSLQSGDKSVFGQKDQVFLSDELAVKYFGTQSPEGQVMSIKMADGVVRSFQVGGVFALVPENATFRPDLVLSFDHYIELFDRPVDWSDQTSATFVLLQPGGSPAELGSLLAEYKDIRNSEVSRQPISSYELFPLDGLGNQAEWIDQPIALGNSESGAYVIAFAGVLILVLACFNYLNLAVSSGTARLKEIAVRKTMGGNRRLIIYQFLLENIFIVGVSMVFGTALCYFLLLPGFNTIAPVDLPFSFSSPERAVVIYLGIWLLVSLFSGAYPAFYISRYQPTTIFNGKQKFNQKNYLSKALLSLQLMITFTAVVGSFIFTDNALYVKNLGWGYTQDELLIIRLESESQFEPLLTSSRSIPGITQAAGSFGHIGEDNRWADVDFLDKQFRTLAFDVSPGYLETIQAKLLSGRFLEGDELSDDAKSVVVNEEFVTRMGWDDGVGRRFLFQGENRHVVGVVANIRHSYSFADVRPMVFTSSHSPAYNHLIVRYEDSQLDAVNRGLEASFHQTAPDEPYSPTFQSELYAGFNDNMAANNRLTMFISAMTILLSCLGLYGLIAFRVQIRLKEFGIRIVLGARGKDIARLASKEYVWLVLAGLVIGVPLGTMSIHGFVVGLLTVSKPFSLVPVMVAMAVTLTAVGLTVVGRLLKAVKVNPAETLKGE